LCSLHVNSGSCTSSNPFNICLHAQNCHKHSPCSAQTKIFDDHTAPLTSNSIASINYLSLLIHHFKSTPHIGNQLRIQSVAKTELLEQLLHLRSTSYLKANLSASGLSFSLYILYSEPLNSSNLRYNLAELSNLVYKTSSPHH
jgi:hypothetical protein